MAKKGFRNFASYSGKPIFEDYPDIPVDDRRESGTKEYFTYFHFNKNSKNELQHIILTNEEIKSNLYTMIKPPKFSNNEIAIFNIEKQKWEIVEDYTGHIAYNIHDQSVIIIDDIGPLPKDYTLEKPPSKFYRWSKKENKWVYNEKKNVLENMKQEVISKVSKEISKFIVKKYPQTKQFSDQIEITQNKNNLIAKGKTNDEIEKITSNLVISFVKEHTKFKTIQEFISKNVKEKNDQEDIEQITKSLLRQQFVQKIKKQFRKFKEDISKCKKSKDVEKLSKEFIDNLEVPLWFNKL